MLNLSWRSNFFRSLKLFDCEALWLFSATKHYNWVYIIKLELHEFCFVVKRAITNLYNRSNQCGLAYTQLLRFAAVRDNFSNHFIANSAQSVTVKDILWSVINMWRDLHRSLVEETWRFLWWFTVYAGCVEKADRRTIRQESWCSVIELYWSHGWAERHRMSDGPTVVDAKVKRCI